MRKKIQELAYAKFREEKPVLALEEERLELVVLEGENYMGSFSMHSTNEFPLRGIVYSTNPRMKCLLSEFEGMRVTVPFEFHSEGLIEGDVQKGDFYIICDGGEYNLSFAVSMTRFYTQTSLGKIWNLFEFANLAQTSWTEAYRMFQAPFFTNIIKDTEQKERLLYQALGGSGASQQDMEEFLIGIRKKQPVEFLLIQSVMELEQVECETMETLSLRKSQWGYLGIEMTSDHEAAVPVKSRITTEDFVGNLAEAGFVIRPQYLHAGKNYIRLTFTGIRQKAVCELCIRQGGREEEPAERTRRKRSLLVRLTSLYLDVRMQRIVIGVWAKESCACLEQLRELEPENLWYVLYQAQALLINKQRQEAEWHLDHFRRSHFQQTSPLYAFYLYVTTIQEREPSYVSKCFSQIQEIYRQNQENLYLFYIMLLLDPQLNQSDSRKLKAIRERMEGGADSPILLMEAYRLLKKAPYLLTRPEEFERRVLYWAVRQKALTPELTEQIKKLVPQIKQYHFMWYRILLECCQKDDSQEMCRSFCSCCVKWNLTGEEQFAWYERGIKENFRIAGLYEAWMSCAELQQLEQFPRSVLLYFQYQDHQSTLSYKKQAMLYRCIVEKKNMPQSLYEAYQDKIRGFALRQLLEGRMDENLAVLYEDLLEQCTIDEVIAGQLEELLFMHRISCEDGRARRLILLQHELKGEQRVTLTAQKGYTPLLSLCYVILAEDDLGNRYIPGEALELCRLMSPGRYLKWCMKAKPCQRNFLIAHLERRQTWQTYQQEDLPGWMFLMQEESVSEGCRQELKLQMMEYYYHAYTGSGMDDFLNWIDEGGMPRSARNQLLELMIARGIYGRAYQLLKAYGSEQMSVSKLMIIAGQKMQETDYEEDEFLLGLCEEIFRRGKYNEYLLHYLLLYQRGNIRMLEQLWKAAREFDLDTHDLEERFLIQLLYTEGYSQQMEEIFSSYFDKGGNEMVVMAYLTSVSHRYVVDQTVAGDLVFERIQQQIEWENPLNDSCRLACFQWLAQKSTLTEQQERLLEQLLQEYLQQKRYFAFYHLLPRRLLRKYRFTDRAVLEYRTRPGRHVFVNYACDRPQGGSAYVEEELQQMYEGIYGKCFVAFYGEEIPYYIREEREQGSDITQSGHIQTEELAEQGEESMYGLLNDMMISYQLDDMTTLRQLNNQYQEKLRRVKELFRLL